MTKPLFSLPHRVVLSPPFGHYLRFKGAVSILGSFTLHPRSHALWRFLKTVRPYHGGFVNAIGLRNAGIGSLALRKDKCLGFGVSLAVVDAIEWQDLARCIRDYIDFGFHPLYLELNISCPNVGCVSFDPRMFSYFRDMPFPLGVKVMPALSSLDIVHRALDNGVQAVHCSNTVPSPLGGISGPLLQTHSLHLIERLRQRFSSTAFSIIGGGGIYTVQDLERYHQAGADYFSLSTVFLRRPFSVRPLIDAGNAF